MIASARPTTRLRVCSGEGETREVCSLFVGGGEVASGYVRMYAYVDVYAVVGFSK